MQQLAEIVCCSDINPCSFSATIDELGSKRKLGEREAACRWRYSKPRSRKHSISKPLTTTIPADKPLIHSEEDHLGLALKG